MLKLFRGVETLRQPDRNPRCYELTEQERLDKIREWNNRNIWNDPTLTYEDALALDLPKTDITEHNMKYLSLLSLLLVAPVSAQSLIVQTVQKPIECFEMEPLFRGLMGSDYKEKPIWQGTEPGATLSRYSLFVNAETKTWTLVQFDEKVACVLGTGDTSIQIFHGPKI